MTDAPDRPREDERAIVLLVDDERDVLLAFKGLFELLIPIRVETAESGPEGLEILRRGHVRLGITDYRMQGMNGVDFIRNARKIVPTLPLYLLTAYASEELEKMAIASGARRCLCKLEPPERIARYISQDLSLEPAGAPSLPTRR